VSININRSIGIVVIGRNEGERLKHCLQSIISQHNVIVYVDSGSTDDSVAYAKSLGVHIVNLDLATNFTAGRARNEGAEKLFECQPDTEYIQFIDGDCELVENWLETASNILDTNPEVAIVCGRRRELFPEKSIYNRFCDIEWNTPEGVTNTCGGDVMIRATAFKEVKGFNSGFIAGEEPELGIRLRKLSWTILRIGYDMTLHDAAIFSFWQWWKRAIRSGHAYAETAWVHGSFSKKQGIRSVISIVAWAILLPLVIMIFLIPTSGLSLVLLGLYLVQWFRIKQFTKKEGNLYATSILVGKFAESLGIIKFVKTKLLNQKSKIIEYK
jgi:glycosyltransferase involved in cell wall biosynthesis